ncbi:hypothetical protein [Amycolatopsis pigmentata]|uniref:Uncharacterized protein n=1 Tax=Amycolatopsis pigmentata TaxID=450801 RepID=A0ABW5FQI3_9PSEU
MTMFRGLVGEGARVGEQLRIRRITAYCLLAVCLMVVGTIVTGWENPVRTVAVLLFVGAAPGWALISYVNVRHLSVTWISAIGLSLSIAIVIAQVMVLTKAWHPITAVLVLVLFTVPLLAHHVLRSRPPAKVPSDQASAAPAAEPSKTGTEAGPR